MCVCVCIHLNPLAKSGSSIMSVFKGSICGFNLEFNISPIMLPSQG